MDREALVLVVDDNEMNRDLLSRRLKRQGHRVETAENGRLALERMHQTAYDLVLLDIMMPEMNGFEVLEHAKADETLRRIPIIVISAAEDMENVVKGIKLGAEDYLPKPYNTALLKARITACLEKKWLYDKEQAHLAELNIMQTIDRELNATLDVQKVMGITLDWALKQSGDQAGLIGYLDGGTLNVVASQGYSYELSGEDNMLLMERLPAVQTAVETHTLQTISNTEGAGLLVRAQSQLAMPIIRNSEILALLLLENNEPKQWDNSILGFLRRLSSHVALAIANAQMYEAVQAANLAKTEFVAFVSHELKIPMTSIKGYSDLLLSNSFGEPNEMQTKFLKTIRNNVNRMKVLVSDLSDVSQIESGHLSLEKTAVDLPTIIHDVIDALQTQTQEKQQRISADITPDLPLAYGDKRRIEQVITNLASNANKYTPTEGEIILKAHPITEEETAYIQISVQDNGLGIAESAQATLFDKFVRVDDREANKAPGTGLGLNITKSLVEMHGGRIWLESTYRQGTTFYFTIPVCKQNNE